MKRNNFKGLLSKTVYLSVAAGVLFATSNVAEAKLYNYDITQENFPAADYASRYEDVKEAFGEDSAALYNHYKYYGVIEGRIVKITKEVLESQANSESAIGATKIYALDVLSTIVSDDMSDAEKVRAVESWMQANITYGTTGDTNSYHITGPMASLPTVEEGYAETFEFFMDALGIQALTTSDLKANKVQVDGVWYDINIPAGVLY